jgi:hypothetical protein
MDKKEVFSELKKQISSVSPSSEPQKTDSKKTEQKENPKENSTELFKDKFDSETKSLLKQRKMLKIISLFAIIITILGIVIFFTFTLFSNPKYDIDESLLAAKVYDPYGSQTSFKRGSTIYITKSEILEWKNFLETQNLGSRSLTEKDVLYQLIAYELLVSESKRQGIRVSEEEIGLLYEKYNHFAQFMLLKILSEQNITENEFRLYLENTILIEKLFSKMITVLDPSENEIDNYLLQNGALITEQMKIQNYGRPLSDDEIKTTVKMILIEKNKIELQNAFIKNLVDGTDIEYYNEYAILMEK